MDYTRDKSRPVTTLKGGRQSKSADNFLKEGFNHFGGFFCLPPPILKVSSNTYKYLKFPAAHLSQIYLSVLGGAGSSVLGPRLGTSDSSLRVIFSTNHATLSDLLDGPL